MIDQMEELYNDVAQEKYLIKIKTDMTFWKCQNHSLRKTVLADWIILTSIAKK